MNPSSTIDNVLAVDDLITSPKVYLKRFKDYTNHSQLLSYLKLIIQCRKTRRNWF